MIQDIKAPISVLLAYNHKKNTVAIPKVIWDGREYKIRKVGMHYTYRVGNALMHVFSVSGDSIALKLVFNSDSLFWTVEQISDGLPN